MHIVKLKKRNEEMGRGYFESDAFSYLSKVSNEKTLEKREILKIIKKCSEKKNFLDIGAGVGDISLDIAKQFKKSILIEPGDKMFKLLKYRVKNNKKINIKLIKSNWEDFYSKNEEKFVGKFNLITLVHVVYFLDPLEERLGEILKFLSPKGKLIIVCPSPAGEKVKPFKKYFNSHPDYLNIPKMNLGKMKYIDIFTHTKLRVFEEMEKNPLSLKNKPTNYYLKFKIKKEFRELTKKDKIKLLSIYKKYKKGDYYYIPGGSRLYIIEK